MKKTSTLATVIFMLLVLIVAPLTGAETIPFASDIPYSDYALLEEPLTVSELTDLFLSASGVTESRKEGYRRKIRTLLTRSDGLKGGEALLQFMHQNILKRYHRDQTRLDTLLDKGGYNCVSSAALYMILTRYHGIPVGGIQTRDHAFCIILPSEAGGQGIDVETTSEWGYNPGEKKEFQSAFTGRTGFAYVPPANYRERNRIGDRDMAGLILQNRIVELQERNRHMEALTLGADRYRLTGSEQAKQDYYNTIQNAAAQLNGQRKYDRALSLLDEAEAGLETLPDFLFTVRSQILFNACAEALNKGEVSTAAALLAERRSALAPADARSMENQIRAKELEIRAKGAFSEPLIEEIRLAAEQGVFDRGRAASLAGYHYSLRAEAIAGSRSYRAAYEFLLEVPSWVQRDGQYHRLLAVYKENTAVDYHNRIVTLINGGNRAEAKRVLDEGLRLLPDSSILKSDRRKLGL